MKTYYVSPYTGDITTHTAKPFDQPRTPKWTNAPTWANYLVQNSEGRFYWCAEKPVFMSGVGWVHPVRSRTEIAGFDVYAREMWLYMEQRPKNLDSDLELSK